MPPKKKANSQPDQGSIVPQGNLFSEGADPMIMAIAVIDKKARNLEKRKVCSSEFICQSLSVCLSGTRILMQKMQLDASIVRVSGYYQILFAQIFGK